MDVPPELINGFFKCIRSDGTLKLNPATNHHNLINCSQNTRLNFVILGQSLENSHGRLYKKIRKKRTYNNNFPSVVFTLLRCVYGCLWPACACVRVCSYIYTKPRQQKFRAMNGAHLASPIRGELGYAHWPQLGT